MGRTRYPAGYRPARNRYRLPHQGEREIERRKRQAARNEARQIERAANSTFASLHGAEKLSRRGRVVPANAGRN
ncbi:hypothetical protein D2V04_06155 [Pelagerythrobacter aerophilus]|uniref:Uncharacterized protein n=2 Tax=Pelagerythrobacter aerophilus TaxID=2306995 RepID=A0A418NJR2_9SPHN|nr:hypothetical protein D2V04_06155 [Pelagerythrobacter aerophilus]